MLTHMRYYLHYLIISMSLCACFETEKGNESKASGEQESVFETEERHFEQCLSKNESNCLQNLVLRNFDDVWRKDEVKLMDSVFIEQVSHNSSWNSARGYSGELIKSHALRLNLGNWGNLQVARSKKNPDNLEFVLRMITGSRGKSSDVLKIAVPLMLGFKMTGMLIFSIIVVKILLLKSLVISKIALLAAGYLVVKQLLSSRLTNHQSYSYHQYPLPYYHEPHHDLEAADYGYYGYGTSGNGEADMQAHFSGNAPETVVPVIVTNHTGNRRDGTRRQAISLVKSRLNPVSIVTYRKVTHTGRSAQQTSLGVQ